MNGNQILSEVQSLIGNMGYYRYSDINRAYREIGRVARHNWLRGESEEMLEFVDGVSSYWIDLGDVRVFKALHVKGNDSGAKYWHLMEEVSPELFEDKRVIYLQSDGVDREDRPVFYQIVESIGQRIKIQVTPVPDETYATKVQFIKDIETIDASTTPTMPHSYHDIISNLAAGMILARDPDPKERVRGAELKTQAMKDAIMGLTKDAHVNRIKSINRPRRSVNEFI